MNSTTNFQQVLKTYLDRMAEQDEAFSIVYANEDKSIEECATYVVECVAQSAKKMETKTLGMSSDEVFGLAVHYYQEDNIEVSDNLIHFNVITDERSILSEDDKAAIRAEAVNEYLEQQKAEKKARDLRKAIAKGVDKRKEEQLQLSLFA